MEECQMPHENGIPMLYTTGSYYQVGYNVGSFFAERIKRFWETWDDLQNLCIPYMATEKGKRYRETTLKVCRENFPQYIREIQGISDGSGLPFDDIFLLNMSKEVKNVLALEDGVSGCTDIMINKPDTKLMCHNEDCDPSIGSTGYMVNARIVEEGQEVENFTAYCYPGILPGCNVAFNKHGVVFSVNGLYLGYIAHDAPPRLFMNRAVIKARDVEEAIVILRNTNYGSAYGFCTNIGDMKNPSKMYSIELGPRTNESLLHVQTIDEVDDPSKPCHYVHFNKYEHLALPSTGTDSSCGREKRVKQMEAPRTLPDALNILGDTSDEMYPIYRSPKPTDVSSTVFTSVADLNRNSMKFYTGNPARDGAVPLFSLSIMD